MRCETLRIDGIDVGLRLLTPAAFGDARGFFSERWRAADEGLLGGGVNFVQDNYSRSAFGVLRGLHFQYAEPQSKLVTVTRGAVFDVAVDIRPDSPTFGRWAGVELSGDLPQWLWIPAGFAHGFLVTSAEGADFWYKVDASYNAAGEGSIRWDDPEIGVAWPSLHDGAVQPQVSGRDAQAPSLAAYRDQPRF